MAKLSTDKALKEAYEEHLAYHSEIGQTVEFYSKYKVDSIGVVWELEEGDWQCPTCTAIIEVSEPACLCQLVECITATDEIDTELIPF